MAFIKGAPLSTREIVALVSAAIAQGKGVGSRWGRTRQEHERVQAYLKGMGRNEVQVSA